MRFKNKNVNGDIKTVRSFLFFPITIRSLADIYETRWLEYATVIYKYHTRYGGWKAIEFEDNK